MKRELLAKLAFLAESIPDAEWTMEHWLTLSHCGTTGCLIGHGIHRGLIPDLVLHNGIPRHIDYASQPQIFHSCFFDIGQALDITARQAIHLFSPDEYLDEYGEEDEGQLFLDHVTQAMVVKRIRELLHGTD